MIASLLKMALLFAGLSLLAIGGANSVIPEMQRVTVEGEHWLSARDFLDLFAISRLAPGPGSLIVTLIGQRVAGPVGAIVATLAMFGPSCLLVYIAARLWHRARDASWRETAERALAPVAIGLVFASALALTRGTENSWLAYGVTALATATLAVSELHPLIVLAAGGAAGHRAASVAPNERDGARSVHRHAMEEHIMGRLAAANLAACLFALIACSESATLPLSAGIGPTPQLPPPPPDPAAHREHRPGDRLARQRAARSRAGPRRDRLRDRAGPSAKRLRAAERGCSGRRKQRASKAR